MREGETNEGMSNSWSQLSCCDDNNRPNNQNKVTHPTTMKKLPNNLNAAGKTENELKNNQNESNRLELVVS